MSKEIHYLLERDIDEFKVHLYYALFSQKREEIIKGSLRNDDGDDNENGKKAVGLDKQNNNFARATRFFVHFSAVVARLRRESA